MILSKLSDLCDIRSGYSFRGKIEESKDSEYKVVLAKDLAPFTGIDFGSLIHADYSGRNDEVLLRDEDILCIGNGPRLYSAVIRDVPENVVPSSHIWIMRLKSNVISNDYLSWSLNHSQKYFQSMSQGATVGHINRKMLESMEINVPDLQTQKNIVELENLLIKEKEVFSALIERREKLINQIQKELGNSRR
ncbi:restriction endonuclease subunit S [Halobacteriovorax sp. DA5]|uniref:restriction endonuclease subunit S n=1 Tax=Halobacteriovorax sp. DA5 TaxID=2067553 RepID=UPI000CD0E277|nr:restriction endonuclease subunit S [Halobacteriovorax sp. DA5]POB13849.1 hypothetical protein C0Z22_07255 [Halobacteriovorax sp. DA5]